MKEGAEQVAGAVSEGISSAPTPAGVVQGAADGAADLLRGIGQVPCPPPPPFLSPPISVTWIYGNESLASCSGMLWW